MFAKTAALVAVSTFIGVVHGYTGFGEDFGVLVLAADLMLTF